jgi:hypothetical protein
MSGPLTGDAGAAAAVCTEMRRAQAFDTIDSLVRYTARSTAMLEHVAQLIDATFRAARDAAALDDITRILGRPRWDATLLIAVGDIVRDTGRPVAGFPDDGCARERR